MNKIIITTAVTIIMATSAALAQKTLTVEVTNPSKTIRKAQPVVIKLTDTRFEVRCAVVKCDGEEIPSQLDDMDNNGTFDELCFLTDLDKKETKSYSIELRPTGKQHEYKPLVYGDMIIANRKTKEPAQNDCYVKSMSAERGTNPYGYMYHHGPDFESELVGFRVYFDHRQTVDLYGKYKRQLELAHTKFYPTKEDKAAGYGDDVFWCGKSFGLGAVRGWDGKEQQMLDDVDLRTMTMIATGPLRTILEIEDRNWNTYNPGKAPITMKTQYILYGGHRDVQVIVCFNRKAEGYKFATGVTNVKGSIEMSDHKGLRGCWGSDWAVAAKDSAGHKRETVGLGICIPHKYILSEMQADEDNYPFLIGTDSNRLEYMVTFGSDNEEYGYHSAKDWFEYLKEWKKDLEAPVEIRIKY